MSEVSLNSTVVKSGEQLNFTITDPNNNGLARLITIVLTKENQEIDAGYVNSVLGSLTSFLLPDDLVGGEYSIRFSYTEDDITSNIYIDTIGQLTLQKTTVQQNDFLTIDSFGPQVNDVDGVSGDITYTWLLADNNNGANAESKAADYQLSQADVGKYIQLQASYTNGPISGFAGYNETLTSSWIRVENINDLPAGLVIFTPTNGLKEGEVITADLSNLVDMDGLPNDYIYIWKVGSDELQRGISASFTLTQAQVGQAITLELLYTDLQGSQESISATTNSTVLPSDDAPVVSSSLAIQGEFSVGSTLSLPSNLLSLVTDEDGIIENTLNYTWYSGEIEVGSEATYQLASADEGKIISVKVTYSDNDGFTAADGLNQFTIAASGVVKQNYPMAGSLILDGNVIAEDQILTINTSQVTDENGNPTSFDYQWYRDGVVIQGQTGVDYTLTQADVGKTIGASVSYTDGDGFVRTTLYPDVLTESVVANVNDEPTGLIISGEFVEGKILTALGLQDEDGLPDTLGYQWLKDGNDIAGANAQSYTIQASDIGGQLGVKVSYKDLGDTEESVMVNTETVVKATNKSPTGSILIVTNQVDGIVEGQAAVNTILMAETDVQDANGMADAIVTYQWLRDGEPIEQATNETYTLTAADIDFFIQVELHYIDDDGYENSLISNEVEVVPQGSFPLLGSVSIAGTLVVGSTLSVVENNVSDADGIASRSYVWTIGENKINTETYILQMADVGKSVAVEVTYKDTYETESALSATREFFVIEQNHSPQGNLQIYGSFFEKETLTVSDLSVIDNDGKPVISSFEWYRVSDGTATLIQNAFGSEYVLTKEDINQQILVKASYTDNYGTVEHLTSELSRSITNVNDKPKGQLEINGNPTVGSTLISNIQLIDADGFDFENGSITYQWFTNTTPIVNANADSYVITEAELGKSLHLEISYTDDLGTEETASSINLMPVLNNLNDVPNGYILKDGFFVDSTGGFDKPYLGETDEAKSAAALQFISNKLSDVELDSISQTKINELFTGNVVPSSVSASKVDLTSGNVVLESSGTDFLLLDASEGTFGNKLSFSNEKIVAVKANSGIVIDASANTTGVELLLDGGAKKVVTGSGDDKITGSKSGDVLAAGAGTNTVDGGDGLDFLALTGSKKDFIFANGQVSKANEVTSYSNVEYLHFDDGLVTVSGNDWADNLIQETWVLI